jgi:hypothetical protein
MNDQIFEDYKPILIERFTENAHRVLANIIEDLGPDLKGIYNSWTWVKSFNKAVKPFYNTATHTLDADRLAQGAAQYANDTVNAWKEKIASKLGMLDTGTLHHLNGADFCITGTKDDQAVSINQTMIINISRLGTLFNQFPARISLNGKTISAAKFKKHFA